MKFRATREIIAADGEQEFEVEAESEEKALDKFKNGEGVLVETRCEVIDLSDYDLDSIWEEQGR